MPITVEVPEIGLIDFPEDFTEDQISKVLSTEPWKQIGGTKAEVATPKTPSPTSAVPPVLDTSNVDELLAGEGLQRPRTIGPETDPFSLATTPLVDLPRVTGREVEIGLGPEGMAAGLTAAAPGVTGPILGRMALQSPKTTAQIIAGLQQAVIGASEFFTSPLGIATLGSGALPKLAQKGIAAYFVYQMAKQQPEMVKELAEAWYSDDPERLTHAAASLGLNTAFIAGGTKAMLEKAKAETPPPIPEQPTTEAPNALQIEKPNAEVLREQTTQPAEQVELRGVVPPHVDSQVTPRTEAAKVERLPRAQQAVGTEPKVGEYRVTEEATRPEIEAAEAKANSEIQDAWPRMTEAEKDNARHGRGIPARFGGRAPDIAETREPPMPVPPMPPPLVESTPPVVVPGVVPHAAPAEKRKDEEVLPSEKAKEEERVSQPKPTPVAEPMRTGPGAMTAGELSPEEAFITSIKNAWTDADAARFGLEPVERGERRHWRQTVIPEAEAEILNNPQAAERIMEKVKADPNYRMQDVETAILLQRKADLINEMNRAVKRLSEAREIKNVENEIAEMVRINDLSDRLQEIRDVSKEAGTPLGQALAARKMLMREDYTLANLVARKASALGRPLEAEELSKITALEAKIKELDAKLKENELVNVQVQRETQIGEAYDETVKVARRAKAQGEQVDSVTEGQNIVDRMKKRLEEGDTAEDLYAYVQKLHENLQRQALDTIGKPLTRVEVVDVIHDILTKEVGLTLPKEFRGTQGEVNTSDLISGIGRSTPLTTDTAKLAKMDVREQEQKIGKINRYLNKLAAPKTGPERKKSSAEARQLEKEGRKLARELGIRITDPATQLANSLSAIKTRLRNEIEEIDLAIASKKPMVKKDGGVAYDAEAAALRAQRDAKKADYDALFPKEPLTDAQRIVIAEKILERQITEVERQLKSGEIFPPGRTAKPELRSEELDAKKSRLEALKLECQYARDLLQPKPDIKSPEELALEAWRTRTQHRIADIQERILKGDFAARKRTPIQPTTPEDLKLKAELKKIKDEFDIGVARDRLANRTRAEKVWDGVKRTLGSPRQLMSSWDLSAVLRQGGFIGFGHPVRAAKSLKPMLDALRSEDRARIEEQKIFNRENYKNGLYQRAKLYLAPLEGMKPSRAEEVFIPSYAERVLGVQASQRAYVTFLNKLRADSFDAMITGFAKRGKGLNDVELRAIANYVNAATGRGNLGRFAAAGEGLSLAFFSPRLVASRFQLLAGEPLMRGSMATRKAIAQEYARFAIGLSVVYGLGALAGAEIETDPRSSDFGKLRFGKTRIDPLMGLAQNTVLLSRLATGEKVTAKGKEVPIRGKVPFGQPDAYEVGADWLRTKFSPIFGGVWTGLTGKAPGGQEQTLGETALGLVVPLAWQDVLKVMDEQGIPRGTAIEILSLLGMGVQNYDEQRKVR